LVQETDWGGIDVPNKHIGTDFGVTSIAVFAEDARQLTCSGTMIEPSAMSRSPETVILTLGPAQKLTLDLGQGAVNAVK
jgi:hypothetical protein